MWFGDVVAVYTNIVCSLSVDALNFNVPQCIPPTSGEYNLLGWVHREKCVWLGTTESCLTSVCFKLILSCLVEGPTLTRYCPAEDSGSRKVQITFSENGGWNSQIFHSSDNSGIQILLSFILSFPLEWFESGTSCILHNPGIRSGQVLAADKSWRQKMYLSNLFIGRPRSLAG